MNIGVPGVTCNFNKAMLRRGTGVQLRKKQLRTHEVVGRTVRSQSNSNLGRKQFSPSTSSRRQVATQAISAPIAAPAPPTEMDQLASKPVVYEETGKWRENFDLKGWAKEVRQVGAELAAQQGEDDVKHLKKIVTWANLSYFGSIAAATECNPCQVRHSRARGGLRGRCKTAANCSHRRPPRGEHTSTRQTYNSLQPEILIQGRL